MLPSLYSNLIACWPLQEASGNRASHNLLNDLTDTNTVTQNPSPMGFAAQFTAASSEYLSRADNADLSMGDIDLTITGWMYIDSKTTARPMIMKGSSSTTREYMVQFSDGTDRFRFVVYNSGGVVGIVPADALGSPSLATWYFIRGWHDALNNVVGIQVNALAENTAATTNTPQDSTAETRIGRDEGANYMDGRLAMLTLHKRLLTTQEHTWLYNNGRGRLYPFDGRPFNPSHYNKRTFNRHNRITGVAQ